MLSQQRASLTIVNTRKTALQLFQALQMEGKYYLTTLLCPVHRRKILAEIKERLRQGQPCTVVATSLIEAGVDVDFPVVYRELAGLDSIVQAAGRCNREGRAIGLGPVSYTHLDVYKRQPANNITRTGMPGGLRSLFGCGPFSGGYF